jgi:uncharacterized protein YjbI with pentapeptide repeats
MPKNNSQNVVDLQRKGYLNKLGANVKTVSEYLKDVLDLFGEKKDSGNAEDKVQLAETAISSFQAVAPFLEQAGEVIKVGGEGIPFAKLIGKFVVDLTKITDPEKLGFIACNSAYIEAIKLAVKGINAPAVEEIAIELAKEEIKEITLEEVDFSTFTLENAVSHKFRVLAEQRAEEALWGIGYRHIQQRIILEKARDQYKECLSKLLLDEKFKPFAAYIKLDREDRVSRKDLARHAEYQLWKYSSEPVLGREPFALKDVYIKGECGFLTWGEICGEDDEAESAARSRRIEARQLKLDAFSEEHGKRHKMIDLIINLIGDEKKREAIIIQGVAGSGKTSFTLRLFDELVRRGLHPIRIRLRDVALTKSINEALPRAVSLGEKLTAKETLFQNNRIFEENGFGDFSKISRYVLILDGWDELSVSASEGFRSRVEKMLQHLKSEFIENRSLEYPVKIILTGRPSADVTESNILSSRTPILTLRNLTNPQLRNFVDKIDRAVQPEQIAAFKGTVEEFPADFFEAVQTELDYADWEKFKKEKFDSVLKKYDHENKILEVLGLPLLAHLATRLITEWKGDAASLVENETTLYRNLVNLTCAKAGKAQTDKRTPKAETKDQARVSGTDLRKLLWATASAMSVFGEESISHDELERRLNAEDELKEIVRKISGENWLSSLLISFYFKGGVKELGCEFSHKSFREYLFAEAVVEELKRYGREAKENYPERENYWEDFPEKDARRELSRRLSLLLASQWLKNEVIEFLKNLLEWEINRVKGTEMQEDAGIVESPLSLEEWRSVRDGMADVWGWWAESAHLRPQAVRKKGKDIFDEPPFVHELIQHCLPFSEERELPSQDANAMDAHLGEAFCLLNVCLHHFLLDEVEEYQECRKYQSTLWDGRRFKPASTNDDNRFDFYQYCGRVNSVNNRPRGIFPENAYLTSIDLREMILVGLIFFRTNLRNAHLFNTNCLSTIFDNANLDFAILQGANLQNATFRAASLRYANLQSTVLFNANLTETLLYRAHLEDALLDNAKFFNVDLSFTFVTEEQLKPAHINNRTRIPINPEGYHKEYLARTKK